MRRFQTLSIESNAATTTETSSGRMVLNWALPDPGSSVDVCASQRGCLATFVETYTDRSFSYHGGGRGKHWICTSSESSSVAHPSRRYAGSGCDAPGIDVSLYVNPDISCGYITNDSDRADIYSVIGL